MAAKPETEAERLRRVQLWETWIKSVGDSAREAWDSGRSFHVVKLNLGGSTAGFMSMVESEGDDAAGALPIIESVGWRVSDVGYVYQPLNLSDEYRALHREARSLAKDGIIQMVTLRSGSKRAAVGQVGLSFDLGSR